jgi:hypothetical protein
MQSYYVGQITATGMMIRTQTFENEWSWRLPLLIQVSFFPTSLASPNKVDSHAYHLIDRPCRIECPLRFLGSRIVSLLYSECTTLLNTHRSNRPRWLYATGKPDKARQILAKLHSSTGDLHSPLIDLEVEEIEEKIALDGADSMLLFLAFS